MIPSTFSALAKRYAWASRIDWKRMTRPETGPVSESDMFKFDPTLVAVFERSRIRINPDLIDIRIYKKPKPGKPDKPDKPNEHSPVFRARQIYREWLRSLPELSRQFLDSVKSAIDLSPAEIGEEGLKEFKRQLNQWIGDQRDRLQLQLKDAPKGIAKKLMRRADLRLGETRDELWTNIGIEVSRHTENVQKARETYRLWNESLADGAGQWLEQVNRQLALDPDGVISDEEMGRLSGALDQWIAGRKGDLESRLEQSPTGIRNALLAQSDESLEALRQRLWTSVLSSVDAYKEAAEQLRKTYDDWDDALPGLSSRLLDAINAKIFEDADDITDDEKSQFQAQLNQWLEQQLAEIERRLGASPEGYRSTLLDEAGERLNEIVSTMNRFIQDALRFRADGDAKAQAYYNGWSSGLGQRADAFLKAIVGQIEQDPDRISDQERQQYEQQLRSWIDGLKNEFSAGLSRELNDTLTGVLRKYTTLAHQLASGQYEPLWSAIQSAIQRWNDRNIPGPGNGNGHGNGHPHRPHIFRPGKEYKFEYGYGEQKLVLSLKKPSSKKGSAMLYVRDDLGNVREISFKFGSADLEKKFKDLLKKHKLYGATLSLKKFDTFLDDLKKGLRDVTEIDPNRLKSELYKDQETAKLDQAFLQLIELFKTMVW